MNDSTQVSRIRRDDCMNEEAWLYEERRARTFAAGERRGVRSLRTDLMGLSGRTHSERGRD